MIYHAVFFPSQHSTAPLDCTALRAVMIDVRLQGHGLQVSGAGAIGVHQMRQLPRISLAVPDRNRLGSAISGRKSHVQDCHALVETEAKVYVLALKRLQSARCR